MKNFEMKPNTAMLIKLLNEKINGFLNKNNCKSLYEEILDYKDSLDAYRPESMTHGTSLCSVFIAFFRLHAMIMPIEVFGSEIWHLPFDYPQYNHTKDVYELLKSDTDHEMFSMMSTLCTNGFVYEFLEKNGNSYNFTHEKMRELSKIDLSTVDKSILNSLETDVFYINFNEPIVKHNDDDTIAHYHGAFVEISTKSKDEFKISYALLTTYDKIIENSKVVDDNHESMILNFAGYTFDQAVELINKRYDPNLDEISSMDKALVTAILEICKFNPESADSREFTVGEYSITEYDVK